MPYKYRQLDNHYTAQDKPKPPVKEKNKRPASHQRQLAENKAINKKLTKLGGVPGMFGITRTKPKGPNESEAQYLLRIGKESFNGFSDVTNGIKKVVKKVRG